MKVIFLDKSLIIPKETILYHINLHFIKKTCGNCLHLCTLIDWDGFKYTSCYLANKDFIITRNDRKKYSCIRWELNKKLTEYLNNK